MIICPSCGRKIDEKNSVVIPEHLNYMKTGICSASRKDFQNAVREAIPNFMKLRQGR